MTLAPCSYLVTPRSRNRHPHNLLASELQTMVQNDSQQILVFFTFGGLSFPRALCTAGFAKVLCMPFICLVWGFTHVNLLVNTGNCVVHFFYRTLLPPKDKKECCWMISRIQLLVKQTRKFFQDTALYIALFNPSDWLSDWLTKPN